MKHFSSPRPRSNDFNLFLAKENCFNEKQTESILEELKLMMIIYRNCFYVHASPSLRFSFRPKLNHEKFKAISISPKIAQCFFVCVSSDVALSIRKKARQTSPAALTRFT